MDVTWLRYIGPWLGFFFVNWHQRRVLSIGVTDEILIRDMFWLYTWMMTHIQWCVLGTRVDSQQWRVEAKCVSNMGHCDAFLRVPDLLSETQCKWRVFGVIDDCLHASLITFSHIMGVDTARQQWGRHVSSSSRHGVMTMTSTKWNGWWKGQGDGTKFVLSPIFI
jgi:hypothetical protein